MPKVSVVIPCFNVERYVRQCLDSLIDQTLSDIEILCVDDGSTDETLSILKDYAARDNRIRILEQENKSAGAARNLGLAAAQGEYVIFLDSDDFFDSRLLELSSAAADEKQADIVVFGVRRYDDQKDTFYDKSELPRVEMLPDADAVFSASDIPDCIFTFTTPAPWTKLYRRSFVTETGLQFQPLPNTNDAYFTLSSLALAKRICTVQEPLVFYRVNAVGSTQGGKHRAPLCFLTALEALHDTLVQRDCYDLLKGSFRALALSMTYFSLSTLNNDEARYAVLDALDSERFARFDLLGHEPEFYTTKQTYSYAELLSSALAQYRITRRKFISNPIPVVSRRAQTPVLVSVVIPVFNTAPYLDETLSSISGQTLKEIEIICIDDGSTDDSLAILQQWAQKDPRISVFHQENAGLSATRNTGMKIAAGTYLYFMDSDDKLEADALRILTEKAERDKLDVLLFDADTFFENAAMQKSFQAYSNVYIRHCAYDEVRKGRELFRILRDEREYSSSVCLQFFRKAYLLEKNLVFHTGIVHEDQPFTFSALLQADRVAHINQVFFHRRMREDSIMTSAPSFKGAYGYFAAYQDMTAIYGKAEPQLTDAQKSAALQLIGQILVNVQDLCEKMTNEQLGARFGLGSDCRLFERIVYRTAVCRKQNADLQARLQKAYDEQSRLKAKLQNAWALNDQKKERLQLAWDRNKELQQKLQAAREQLASYKERLQLAWNRNKEIQQKLEAAREQLASYKERLQLAWNRSKELQQKLQSAHEQIVSYKDRIQLVWNRNKELQQKLETARKQNKTGKKNPNQAQTPKQRASRLRPAVNLLKKVRNRLHTLLARGKHSR